jgi:hypothetical protein
MLVRASRASSGGTLIMGAIAAAGVLREGRNGEGKRRESGLERLKRQGATGRDFGARSQEERKCIEQNIQREDVYWTRTC